MTNIRTKKDHLTSVKDDLFLGHGEEMPEFGHTIIRTVILRKRDFKGPLLERYIPKLDLIPLGV
ncbi:hypothetical protein XI25_19205 [Paenibacillus sp. DMB20]|nr:hypothetical protein XI25_19205 [Paenibacillus sp. DMB20]